MQRGVLATTQDYALLPSQDAEREAALCGLAAGPGQITGPLCATDSGFSLPAATVVAAGNVRGKQALLR